MQNPFRLALGGLVAMAAGIGIGRFVYTPILPAMIPALGLSASSAGMIASANFLGYLVGAVGAGSSRIRGSRRTWLLVALAINAVALILMGSTKVLAYHLVLRFVGGIASAFILVFASSLVLARLDGADKNNFSSLHFAGVGFGIIVSAVAVAILSRSGANWESFWFASGAICLLALMGAAILIRDDGNTPTSHSAKLPTKLSTKLRFLIAAYGLFGFGYVITATFLIEIVRRSQEIASLEVWIWVVFGVCALPSVALWNRLIPRFGVPGTFAIACIVEAIGVAVSVLWPSLTGVLLAAIFLGGTFMGITALGLTAARNLTAGDPRRSIALMTAAFGFGQIIGPALAGFMADLLGSFTAATLIAAASLVIAASLAMWTQQISH